jgi:hypothetical protein
LCDVAIQADILQVFSHQVGGSISRPSTFAGRLEIIELLHKLGESLGDQLISRNPGVISVVKPSPFDFVLKGLLQLLPS